jgi:PAS domain S-box-containing protein
VDVPRRGAANGGWSAERAAALLDAIPSRVSWWDAQGRIRYANAGALAYARRTWPELAGADPVELIGPEHFAAERHHFAAALAGDAQQYDREISDEQRGHRYEQVHVIPFVVGGERNGVIVHVVDGTARVQAQRQARREHERLALRRARHSVATALQQTVFAKIGQAMQVLERACGSAGSDRDALIHDASERIDDAITSLRDAIAALRRGRVRELEGEPAEPPLFASADRAEPVVTPLPDPSLGSRADGGATCGLTCEVLELILDHLPAAVTTWDPHYFNMFANRPAARWYGFRSGAEMRGMHGSELLGPAAYRASLPLGEAAMGGTPTQFVRAIADADGRLRHAQVTYRAHLVDGELVGAVALVFDVTSHVEAEAELQESLDQAAVLNFRERMAEDLHDLVIQRLYATNLALTNTTVAAEQRIADAVDTLGHAVQELREAVLDLHRHPVEVEARTAIGRLLNHAAHALPTAPVLRWHGPQANLPLDVVNDMLAVVNEAVSNAVRHGRPRHVAVDVTAAVDEVRIRVCDDGTGMSPRGRRSGLANLAARARRRGGRMVVRRGRPAGTVVDWRAPLPAAPPVIERPRRGDVERA